jgi:hypothetical protein
VIKAVGLLAFSSDSHATACHIESVFET